MQSIKIIPWEKDFISSLDRLLTKDLEQPATGQTNQAKIIVFPHQRPKRYLFQAWRQDNRSRPLPKLYTYEEFIQELSYLLGKDPCPQASPLEQCALLYELLLKSRSAVQGVFSRLGSNLGEFLPWGLRLANLLEELLRQGADPNDLPYLEGLNHYAAELLADLKGIYQAYLNAAEEKKWTTFGLNSHFVSKHLARLNDILTDWRIIIAGFSGLTTMQDRLFRFLWENLDARIIIHSDPNLGQRQIHFAAQTHISWLNKWQARPEIIPPYSPDPQKQKTPLPLSCKFYEGYDLHSQLQALKKELARNNAQDPNSSNLPGSTGPKPPGPEPKSQKDQFQNKRQAKTAIILCNSNSLLPVMHCLPDETINISLGYPLTSTRSHQLLKSIFALAEHRDEQGKFYWQDLLQFLQNPILKTLTDNSQTLGPLLSRLCTQVCTGPRFVHLKELDMEQGEGPWQKQLLIAIQKVSLALLDSTTLEKFAAALSKLLDLICSHLPEDDSYPYLLEQEAIHRLKETIPCLTPATISTQPLPWKTILSAFELLVAQERIPFAAETLNGLQVLGLLEARLLAFDKLIFVDITEDNLPGESSIDPLLPDHLRPLVGLTSQKTQDEIMTYHFYSLLAGTKRAVFCYQTGIKPGLFQDKSTASRFVEQLIWDLEQERKQLSLDFPLELKENIAFPITLPTKDKKPIVKTQSISDTLQTVLETKGLTPSNLNTLLTCPKKFFFSALTPLTPLPAVMEEGDRSLFGQLVHNLLRKFLTPHVGKKITKQDLSEQNLLDLYARSLEESAWSKQLTLENRLGLKLAGEKRLKSFLLHFPETTIIALERALQDTLVINKAKISIKGRIDRIDLRDDDLLLLDYKTGKPPKGKVDPWLDEQKWKSVQGQEPTLMELVDIFAELKDVQMPFYLYLYHRTQKRCPSNCLWVELADKGTERSFLNQNGDPDSSLLISRHFEILLTSVSNALQNCDSFPAQTGPHCEFCVYNQTCCT